VHNFYDRDFLGNDNKRVLLTSAEKALLARCAAPAEVRAEGHFISGADRGLFTRIVQTLMKEPAESMYRFWLSSCLESFLRGSGPEEQVFIAVSGILGHTVAHIADTGMRASVDANLQTAFDLLGELVKGNQHTLEMVDAALGDHSSFRRFMDIALSNLVDSNVFLRSLFLSVDIFYEELAVAAAATAATAGPDVDAAAALAATHRAFIETLSGFGRRQGLCGYLTQTWVQAAPPLLSARAAAAVVGDDEVDAGGRKGSRGGGHGRRVARSRAGRGGPRRGPRAPVGRPTGENLLSSGVRGALRNIRNAATHLLSFTGATVGSGSSSNGSSSGTAEPNSPSGRRAVVLRGRGRGDDFVQRGASHGVADAFLDTPLAYARRLDGSGSDDGDEDAVDREYADALKDMAAAPVSAAAAAAALRRNVERAEAAAAAADGGGSGHGGRRRQDVGGADEYYTPPEAPLYPRSPRSGGGGGGGSTSPAPSVGAALVAARVREVLPAAALDPAASTLAHVKHVSLAGATPTPTATAPTAAPVNAPVAAAPPVALPDSMFRLNVFLAREREHIVLRLMGTVSVHTINHENICCMNTALLILLLAQRRGQLARVLDRVRRLADAEEAGAAGAGAGSGSGSAERRRAYEEDEDDDVEVADGTGGAAGARPRPAGASGAAQECACCAPSAAGSAGGGARMVRPRLGPSPRRADALLLAAKRSLRGGDSAMDVDSEAAAAADDGLTPLDTDGDGDGNDAAGFVCGVCGLADSGGLPPPAPAAESAARPWAPGYARSPAGAKAPSPLTAAAGTSSSSSSSGARDSDGRGATHVLVNFRELLWYWKEYYLRRGRDRLSIEFSSHIPFALWEALVDTLCRDDGSPEALLPAPVRHAQCLISPGMHGAPLTPHCCGVAGAPAHVAVQAPVARAQQWRDRIHSLPRRASAVRR